MSPIILSKASMYRNFPPRCCASIALVVISVIAIPATVCSSFRPARCRHPSSGLPRPNTCLFEDLPGHNEIGSCKAFSKSTVNRFNKIMCALGLTLINPKSRELQSRPQFERKRRLFLRQRHRLLQAFLSRGVLRRFPRQNTRPFVKTRAGR